MKRPCSKCKKRVSFWNTYKELEDGKHVICMTCNIAKDAREKAKAEETEKRRLSFLSPASRALNEEIERLENSSETWLYVIGILALFGYLLPGIIILAIATFMSRSRQTKIVELRAQQELLNKKKPKIKKDEYKIPKESRNR